MEVVGGRGQRRALRAWTWTACHGHLLGRGCGQAVWALLGRPPSAAAALRASPPPPHAPRTGTHTHTHACHTRPPARTRRPQGVPLRHARRGARHAASQGGRGGVPVPQPRAQGALRALHARAARVQRAAGGGLPRAPHMRPDTGGLGLASWCGLPGPAGGPREAAQGGRGGGGRCPSVARGEAVLQQSYCPACPRAVPPRSVRLPPPKPLLPFCLGWRGADGDVATARATLQSGTRTFTRPLRWLYGAATKHVVWRGGT